MMKTLLTAILLFTALSSGLLAQGLPSDAVAPSTEIVIYPNPFVEYISLDTQLDNLEKIRVVNVIGSEVASFRVTPEGKYDLSHLDHGYYLVQILDTEQKLVATRRLRKAQ